VVGGGGGESRVGGGCWPGGSFTGEVVYLSVGGLVMLLFWECVGFRGGGGAGDRVGVAGVFALSSRAWGFLAMIAWAPHRGLCVWGRYARCVSYVGAAGAGRNLSRVGWQCGHRTNTVSRSMVA